jgi:hypothetical protein
MRWATPPPPPASCFAALRIAPSLQRHRQSRPRRGRRAPLLQSPPAALAPQEPRPGPPTPSASPAREVSDEEAHAASHAQINATLARLAGGTSRWINLDALANALKMEGFTRPPGSPRLVTRLRRMKDVEVSANGMVRLVGAAAQAFAQPLAKGPAGPLAEPAAEHTADAAAPPRRPRRRGGRGRRRPRAETPAAVSAPHDDNAP